MIIGICIFHLFTVVKQKNIYPKHILLK